MTGCMESMRDKVDRNKVFRKAFSDSVPVMAGYGTMGFAAGVLLSVHGGVSMPALWAALSSATFISGPLQYLFVDWVVCRHQSVAFSSLCCA